MVTYINILSNWFFSDVPGNNGFRENNSAMIQAVLHISTELLYGWPRSTSGALYHNVTTYFKVNWKMYEKKNVWLYFLLTTEVNFISKSYVLANPKSANFICPWADTKIFCGFKSRCIIRWECKKSTPVSNSVANFWNVIWILNYIYFSPG